MRITRASLRDFRNYERAELELGAALTVVSGPNGAGKTNLLEALYFGCTGRSPRTSNERELVRRGTRVARVVLDVAGEDGEHRLEVGFEPGEAKHIRVDGRAAESLAAVEERPLVSVFMPERLELVKGRRPAAARTSTASSRRSGPRAPRPAPPTRARWPSATHSSRAYVRATPAPTRWVPGTASWLARASG